MSKVTLATLKSFIRKNADNLLVQTKSQFDGMVDGVARCENQNWEKVDVKFNPEDKRTFGVPGIWFVGGSRDYFTEILDGAYVVGYEVYNCCGTWAVKKG